MRDLILKPTLLAGAALLVLGLVACATSATREPFMEEEPATPAEMPPQQSAPPPKTTQSGPATTESDASVKPDAAPDTCKRTAPSNKCGLVPQCGCTLAETCDVQDTSGAVDCVTAGKAAMGAACIATAGCAVGLTCVFGTCHAFCNNPGSTCTGAKLGGCVQVNAQSGAAIPNLSVCRVACDLRDVTACGPASAAGTGVCQVDDMGNTDCAEGGTQAAGQPCSPMNDCGPGTVCTTSGSSTTGTCKKWCRVGTNDCGGTTACTGFQTKIMVGGVEYGACP
jgi:hypothetical protein